MNRLPLTALIAEMIRMDGPISVETYWNMCLSHPEYGYYIKQDPFGVAGDFTTAPEISQLFGEMVGMWVTLHLQRLGNPPRVYLVECGPGRGTLMADLLRFMRFDPAALASLSVHLVETSPVLQAKQRETLLTYDVTWHADLSSLPTDAPVLIIGNEFLDALPIRQYVRQSGAWHERMIGLDEGGRFAWGLSPAQEIEMNALRADEGSVLEYSFARRDVFTAMCERVSAQRGAALVVDYGHHVRQALGDTFQAIYRHRPVDVLSHQGDADLTSHVDFAQLESWLESYAAPKSLAVKSGSQRDFLGSMGIEMRFAHLMERAQPTQKEQLESGFRRLMDDDQMGKLFRVMEVMDHEG